MFKKDKKAAIAPGQVDTLIGPQVVIRGDFHFVGGLYVEGRIIGKVIASNGEAAQVTIAETGVIEGEVRAPNVVINGQLVGDAYGEQVEMHPKARVNGNVHYQVIEMIAGSTLTGRLVHAETVAASAPDTANVTPITPDVAIG
ncbi:bactofilin family protein [Lysobacter solisilvae (ex Woo and Kim 2020)]|uniref:Polymer-forming cytoskeletal protein n=1 Tax=Agrilutibacter terrestris TaxID=2865112 RepID=A0A7H0FZX8_9GAMM|nr:polymer-forming cytoskeletal protein [Lysobacter terrestris]QNP41594.1 polymer-forming cytoskeletal protein [Lysobacter terrestris]